MTTLLWVEPDLGTISGGLRYNQQLRAALNTSGVQNPVLSLPGDWSAPLTADGPGLVARVTSAAEEHDAGAVVIDGLIGSACPELFTPAEPTRILLVHLSAALAQELEGQQLGGAACPETPDPEVLRREELAVESADHVITASRWSAEQLRRRYGREEIIVALPGMELRPETPTGQTSSAQNAAAPKPAVQNWAAQTPAPADRPIPQLACVSAFLPVKNHRLLAPALEPLLDLPWELTLAGPHSRSDYGGEVIEELRHRLPGRVRSLGTLSPAEVAQLWQDTDLVLLPSAVETYGMVVAEACAAGVPSFIPSGTGAVEAAGEAGVVLDPQRPQEWTAALRQWLSSSEQRADLRARARRRRDSLPSWEQAAQQFRVLLPE